MGEISTRGADEASREREREGEGLKDREAVVPLKDDRCWCAVGASCGEYEVVMAI
jgi:hypothetical protein